MIDIIALSYQYPNTSIPVFENVSCQVKPGSLTLVVGASGSGKSTFLRCINGLVPHFSGGKISGKIDVFGSNPIQEGPENLASKIGFVFQEPEAQFVFDIVEDEIAFALENLGMPRHEMHVRINEILEQFQLLPIRSKAINQLSGGEKQKVALASVLAARPQVLLLDEPTSQLDPVSADQILNLCVALKERWGISIMIAEHRLERLLPYTDSVIYLKNDRQLAIGSPQEIIPTMDFEPPVIKIGRKLHLNPLPLTVKDFPPFLTIGKPLVREGNKLQEPRQDQNTSLSVRNLSTKINGQHILKNVSIDLYHSEILVVLGLNGAGKTTLLRSILGLTPTKGRKFLNYEDISSLPLDKLIKHIAYLPQNPNDLLFAETVFDELKITLENHAIDEKEINIKQFLGKFGLEDKAKRYPRDLSIGERQRVALAAITIHDPQIIFLDEPTRGLDYIAKSDLSKLLTAWRDEGKSILLVTHDVEFAAGLADRVCILASGEIIFTGSPEIGFSQFPAFKTQTAQIFPGTNWIKPGNILDDAALK